MERPCRPTLSAVTVGTGEEVDVLTEPTEVAQECCDYGTRRFGSMEPKWFRPHDVAEGHEVYAVVRGEVVERRSRVHVEVWAHGEKLHILNRFWR